MAWLVTGGAGYIGAHVVRALRPAHDVLVLDDLSAGQVERVPPEVPLIKGDVTDSAQLRRVFRDHRVDGVIHLAARKSAAGSLHDETGYRRTNVDAVRVLLDEMAVAEIGRLIFASSAAVYGDVRGRRAREGRRLRPFNPYGETKAEAEQLIRRAKRDNFASLVFRAFNVVGAGEHPSAMDSGQDGLFPAIFRALGERRPLIIHGHGYGTPDGSAVRDYVHVLDVARAYAYGVGKLNHPPAGRRHLALNLGSGVGHSVRDVLRVVAETTGERPQERESGRRPGDPAQVVADVRRTREWGWSAGRPLADAVRDAWSAWNAAAIRATDTRPRPSRNAGISDPPTAATTANDQR